MSVDEEYRKYYGERQPFKQDWREVFPDYLSFYNLYTEILRENLGKKYELTIGVSYTEPDETEVPGICRPISVLTNLDLVKLGHLWAEMEVRGVQVINIFVTAHVHCHTVANDMFNVSTKSCTIMVLDQLADELQEQFWAAVGLVEEEAECLTEVVDAAPF